MWAQLQQELASFYRHRPYHEPTRLYQPYQIQLPPTTDPQQRALQEDLQRAIAAQVFLRDENAPVALPPSAFLRNELPLDEELARLQAHDLASPQLFPEWSEHRDHAPQPLTASQLAQIRQSGTFTVPSDSFPGQSHTWQLSKLLASGNDSHRNSLYRGLCWAIHHVTAIPRSLFQSGACTLRDSLESIPVVLRDLSGLLVGRPERRLYRARAELLENRRMEYVFREFTPQIVQWIRDRRLQRQQNPHEPLLDPSSGILVRVDPKGQDQQLDMRLYDTDLYYDVIRSAEEVLAEHNSRWQKERFSRVESLVQQLAAAGEGLEEGWEEIALQQSYALYYEQLLHALQASEDLRLIGGHGIGTLLWAKMQASFAIALATEETRNEIQQLTQQYKETIQQTHPIRSHSSLWLHEQAERRLQRHFQVDNPIQFARQTAIRQIERAIAHLAALADRMAGDDMPGVAEKLRQEIYLLERDARWRQDEYDHAVEWITENMQMPARVFSVSIPFWSPRVLHDPTNECYVMKSAWQHMVTTDRWLWRFSLGVWRTYANLQRAVVGTKERLVRSPWCWKALLYRMPFPTGYLLDPKSGRLSPTGYAPTLVSRLRTLWRHVMSSRAQFEAAPDHGFLGKGASRIIHCLWNYAIKLPLGSAIVAVMVPCGVVIAFLWHLVRLVGGVALAPVNTLLRYVFDVLVYDADNAGSMFYPLFPLARILLGKFGCGVVLQAVAALALAFVVHPACSVLALGWNTASALLGYLYDSVLFYAVVKPRGRVPPEDTFLARRIAGPGLSMQYYFHLGEEEVMAVLQLALEECEMSLFEAAALAKIQEPHEVLRSIVSSLVQGAGRFTFESHEDLFANTNHHCRLLSDQIALRYQLKPRTGSSSQMHLVRLNPGELEGTIKRATAHVQSFVMQSIFQQILQDSEDWIERFWVSFDLARDDWDGLTRYFLTKVFSSDFLVPLEPEDCSVELRIQHSAAVEPFLEMIREDEPRDDLERATTVRRRLVESGFSVQKLFQKMQLPGTHTGIHSIPFLSGTIAARPLQLDPDSYGSP